MVATKTDRAARFALASLLLLTAAHSGAAERWSPVSLYQVVAFCEKAQRVAQTPFPCLEVHLPSASGPGFAIVPDPESLTILLSPLAKISGIEDADLLKAEAPNWWKYAWQARYYLAKRVARPLARNDVALAINSKEARSQDQLHIHVGCLRRSVRQPLQRYANSLTSSWARFPRALGSEIWLAMRLDEDELASNPFELLAELKPHAMGDWGMGLIPWTFANKNGFIVLATRQAEHGRGGLGVKLLDPRCR